MSRMRWMHTVSLGVMICLLPLAVRAQSPLAASRDLAAGVSYRRLADARGPWVLHVVEIDLRRARVDVRASRATGELRGRERTTGIARRATAAGDTVLVAVNGDFFDLRTGENENNQVIDGAWWKGLKVTESPYDTYDNMHVQFGMTARRQPAIDRFILDGRAWMRGAMTPILTVNASPSGNPQGTALYTSKYGPTTPYDSTRVSSEVALTAAGRRGDTLLYVARGVTTATSGSAIPAGGAVLAAYGSRTRDLQPVVDGDTVRVLLTTAPRMPGGGSPQTLIGGWPRIILDGVNVAGEAATTEGTISRNAEARHPRTAVGYSRDARRLLIVTVDGRAANSVGMTLVELADAMRRLGVWQAMNFDGGGSTTMVIDGAVVNAPSDPSGEREVGNALLIVKQARRARP